MQFYVRDVMNSSLITVRPTMGFEEVQELLVANRISGAPVVERDGSLLGVITMFDLMQSGLNFVVSPGYFETAQIDQMLAEEGFHVETLSDGVVSDVMTREVHTATPDTPLEEVAALMYDKRIHRVIVVEPEARRPVGIVSTFDLLKVMAESKKGCCAPKTEGQTATPATR